MPDKRLEELVNAAKTERKAKEADIQKQGEAIKSDAIQAGRRAARLDYENWRNAIEAQIGRSIHNSTGSPTLHYDSDCGSGRRAMFGGYRKTIFGSYKPHFYYMTGFNEVGESMWAHFMINGYVSELQDRPGETFKVHGHAGGYETSKAYYADIDHDDGSTSSIYRTEFYRRDPAVIVRW
jgi:hypothetical protein